jgi:hypothetical protein
VDSGLHKTSDWQLQTSTEDYWGLSYCDIILANSESCRKAVDYNKTGVEAEMSSEPHQIYHADKILGQLFNQVLSFAREPKVEYDVSMQQIMAQFDMKTQFEI